MAPSAGSSGFGRHSDYSSSRARIATAQVGLTPEIFNSGRSMRPTTASRPVSLTLIETNRLYGEALAAQLRMCDWAGDVRIVDSAVSAVRRIRSLHSNLVLVSMTGQSSRDALITLRELAPESTVVAVGVGDSDDDVVHCAELGVVGLLPSDATLRDLEALVLSIGRGESSCSPRVTAALLRQVATAARERRDTSPPFLERLSPREHEVLHLIEQGRTNKEIGRMLGIEVRTVKNHVHNLLQKLEVTRRGEAAARLRAASNRVPSSVQEY